MRQVQIMRRTAVFLAALTLMSSATVAGAWAGAKLGVGVKVVVPSLCTAELRDGARQIAVACLHRQGFELHARNRRSDGALILTMGRFRAEIPPGERRRIAGSVGPSAARLPIRLATADGTASAEDLGLEIEPR